MDGAKPVAWAGRVGACAVVACAAAPALAQFGTPGSTEVRERLAGPIEFVEGGLELGEGDQLGAFFDGDLVGAFTFTGEPPTPEFELIIFGDNPDTPDVVEGPQQGDRVELRFYDASTDNVITDVRPINSGGEVVNYRYAGELIPPVPGGFPIDLVPTRELGVRVGTATDGGGNDDGGDGGDGDDGGDAGGGDPDVDGDGRVTTKDAVIVLRFVAGARRSAGVSAARADVNGDGVVSVDDAIAVLRARDD